MIVSNDKAADGACALLFIGALMLAVGSVYLWGVGAFMAIGLALLALGVAGLLRFG